MKKVPSILIVICLIAGLLPVIASAATTAKVSIISDAGGACIQVTDTVDGYVKINGDTVTITARIAPEGKAFDKWEVNEGTITLADPTATSTTFVMPSENVKITALYKTLETKEVEQTEATEETEESAE